MYRYCIVAVIVMALACNQPGRNTQPNKDLLDLYAQQTDLTDPGDYFQLYDILPESIDSICLLIKHQLIHPLEALQKGFSLDQVIEEGSINDTEQILEELMKKDSSGLTLNRNEKNRLLIACHHHAMLLSSILRYRDIPVRMRFGFARYFEKEAGIRFGHVICEVWNETEQRWILVDPDRHYVDFSPDRFDFASEAWYNLKRNKIDKEVYVSSIGDGLKGVVNLLALDVAHVILEERMHWIYPEIALKEFYNFDDLDKKERNTLNDAATLLKNPDQNLGLIDSLYHHNIGFQPSDMDYEDYCRMMEERDK